MHPVRPPSHPGPLGMVVGPVPAGARQMAPVNGSTNGTTYPPPGIATGGMTEWLAGTAQGAEAAGAGAVWAVDHLFWGRPLLECITALTVVAAHTTRALVGTCVLQLPLRTPAAVAKQATALQLLSGGRMVLGVGAGSHRHEYELAGRDFATRGHRLDEGIAALRRAWASAASPGRDAVYRQEPAGPAVPVWVGGSSAAARRRAARLGDGWIPLFVTPGELAAGVARLGEEAASAGRHAPSAAVVLPVAVGDDSGVHARGCAWLADLYGIPARSFARHLVSGPASACAERVGAYLDAGADHVAVLVAADRPLDHFAPLAEALSIRPRAGRASGTRLGHDPRPRGAGAPGAGSAGAAAGAREVAREVMGARA